MNHLPLIYEHVKEYLSPVPTDNNHIMDCTYLLKKDGIFFFIEGYIHPPDGFYGNILYYPDTNGHNNFYGIKYASVNKKLVNGKLERIDHLTQYKRHFEIDNSLNKNEILPPFARYRVKYNQTEFLGIFEHKHTLKVAMQKYEPVKNMVENISIFLEVPLSRLGCTGSLSYGILDDEHDDIDIVFYGSVKQNREIELKIRNLCETEKNRQVFEFGRYWPIRFYHNNVMYCSFFCYENPEEIPLFNTKISGKKENVSFKCRVTDDTHGIYMPPILKIENLLLENKKCSSINTLICYCGFLRGEFVNGNVLKGTAEIVEVHTKSHTYEALLINLPSQVKKVEE